MALLCTVVHAANADRTLLVPAWLCTLYTAMRHYPLRPPAGGHCLLRHAAQQGRTWQRRKTRALWALAFGQFEGVAKCIHIHDTILNSASTFDVHESESRREHATIATTVANMPGSCKTASAVSYSLMYVCVEFYGVIGSTE